jgi:hypothetical protein
VKGTQALGRTTDPDAVLSVIFFIIGVILIVDRKPVARMMIEAQNETWGFRLGENKSLPDKPLTAADIGLL